MSSVLVPILVASFIGYQLDELKMKKYDMTDQTGEVLKVQFSKNGNYSCPLSCSLDHYHYAVISDDSQNHKEDWAVESNLDNKGFSKYHINGMAMDSYTVHDTPKKMPKQMPVAFNK